MSDESNITGVETEESVAAANAQAAEESSETNDDGLNTAAAGQEDGAETNNGENTDDSESANDAVEGSQTPPDTYAEFSLPEGVPLDENLLSEATSLFKELELTQEQAQKLVDFQAKQIQASSQSQVDAFNQLMEDWSTKSKNDSEFGGDKFDESIAVAQAAVNKFGTPELKQLLEEHGVGNHPEVIRFMVNVGKLTAEDVPGGTSVPVKKEGDRVSQLYPNDRNSA